MKKLSEEVFELSSGKVIRPDCGPWGIGKRWVIGFTIVEIEDNVFAYPVEIDREGQPDLTKEEAIELALYMSDQWNMFADSLK